MVIPENVTESEYKDPSSRIQHLVHIKRVRRIAAYTIAVTALLDLVSALTPPLRHHLHKIRQFMPLDVSLTASALVALSGLALLFVARGVRRGQRQAWVVAVILLTLSTVAHVFKGFALAPALISGGVLVFLLITRKSFSAKIDLPSLRNGLVTLIFGGLITILAGTVGIKTSVMIQNRHHKLVTPISWTDALHATATRLIGLNGPVLPDAINDFASTVLGTIGIGLALVALALAFRPIVDRRLIHTGEDKGKAFDIVKRFGSGTLDYFALRDDKRNFFYDDTLVAYAIYGGVCLVSPDPIGPEGEREVAWRTFLHFADEQGWTVCVLAASEQSLPLYSRTGLTTVYMGDEAVVDCKNFSLAGGNFKGLRQAYNRIAKYGYAIEFHDPAKLDPILKASLVELMPKTRKGEAERGFSMTLGRIFDLRDEGLLIAVARDPNQKPVAFCHFVPAIGINGFSLDSMRRDPDPTHPNGLIDFVLCATIFHLKEQGFSSLDLNFSTWRAVLAGESGPGNLEKGKRWILKHLSSNMQIESLWRFNSKYEPSWLPRYVAFENIEVALPAAIAIARAESFAELPLLGRFFAAKPPKEAPATQAAQDRGVE
ncbi:MAG: DUF2156 domain-containing protein [Acidimicrobiales bacterium]|nr:DUF2156 domain-containing protein [Acidimicrobiales bacterium]